MRGAALPLRRHETADAPARCRRLSRLMARRHARQRVHASFFIFVFNISPS